MLYKLREQPAIYRRGLLKTFLGLTILMGLLEQFNTVVFADAGTTEAAKSDEDPKAPLRNFYSRETHASWFYDPTKGGEREIPPATRGLRLVGIRKALRVLYYNCTIDTWEKDQYQFYDYVRATRFYFIGILPPGTPPPEDLRRAAQRMEQLLVAYMDMAEDNHLTAEDKMKLVAGEKGLIKHFDDILKDAIPVFEVYEERRREKPPPLASDLINELIRRQKEYEEKAEKEPESEELKALKDSIQQIKENKINSESTAGKEEL